MLRLLNLLLDEPPDDHPKSDKMSDDSFIDKHRTTHYSSSPVKDHVSIAESPKSPDSGMTDPGDMLSKVSVMLSLLRVPFPSLLTMLILHRVSIPVSAWETNPQSDVAR